MKKDVILKEKPILLLKGSSLILAIMFLLIFMIKVRIENINISYSYLGLILIIIIVFSYIIPKKKIVLKESGFIYIRGNKKIEDAWDNIKDIGVQTNQGKPTHFFIGGKDYKTGLINFLYTEIDLGDRKDRGNTQKILDILKEYSDIEPRRYDHSTYNKSKGFKILIWSLIVLIFGLYIFFGLTLL